MPYLRDVMDAFSDPKVDTVVMMCSAQMGKSEMLNNLIGFHIDQDPSPIMMVQPRESDAKKLQQGSTLTDVPRFALFQGQGQGSKSEGRIKHDSPEGRRFVATHLDGQSIPSGPCG